MVNATKVKILNKKLILAQNYTLMTYLKRLNLQQKIKNMIVSLAYLVE